MNTDDRPAIRYEELELVVPDPPPEATVSRALFWWIASAFAIVAGILIAALLLAAPRTAPGPTSTAPTQSEAPRLLASTVRAGDSGSVHGPQPARGASYTLAATGTASWYCSSSSACTRGYPASGLFAAAGSEIRAWRGELVRVRSGGRSVVVRLIDVCGCPGRRVIDLYASAFRRLAPTSRGVIPVTVTLERALPLPQTDTAGPG